MRRGISAGLSSSERLHGDQRGPWYLPRTRLRWSDRNRPRLPLADGARTAPANHGQRGTDPARRFVPPFLADDQRCEPTPARNPAGLYGITDSPGAGTVRKPAARPPFDGTAPAFIDRQPPRDRNHAAGFRSPVNQRGPVFPNRPAKPAENGPESHQIPPKSTKKDRRNDRKRTRTKGEPLEGITDPGHRRNGQTWQESR